MMNVISSGALAASDEFIHRGFALYMQELAIQATRDACALELEQTTKFDAIPTEKEEDEEYSGEFGYFVDRTD
jgi:hypothetical protein